MPNLSIRIGDRVIVTTGDKFVEAGMTGLIVNVVSARFNRKAQARVLFDNDTVCIMDSDNFQVITKEEGAA